MPGDDHNDVRSGGTSADAIPPSLAAARAAGGLDSRHRRATYLAHPAAASMSAYRTTQGPAELAAVNVILGAVQAAGFEGAQAALTYRAVGDFALAFAGFEAAFLSLDTKAQQTCSAS